MKEFEHKDEYHLRGPNFLVMVTRHSVNVPQEYNFDNLGVNRWCVYAYIYTEHTIFKYFDDSGIFQDAANNLPLHEGASLLKFHYDSSGNKASVQVGADYSHLYDDRFSNYETKEDAKEVFDDAIELFEYLSK